MCKALNLGQCSQLTFNSLGELPAMKTFVRVLATASMLMAAGAVAQAQCINKAGKGTGGNDEFAKFQAWEAVLQGTDWGMWGRVDGLEPESRRGSWLQGEQREAALQCRGRPWQGVRHPGETLQVTIPQLRNALV